MELFYQLKGFRGRQINSEKANQKVGPNLANDCIRKIRSLLQMNHQQPDANRKKTKSLEVQSSYRKQN